MNHFTRCLFDVSLLLTVKNSERKKERNRKLLQEMHFRVIFSRQLRQVGRLDRKQFCRHIFDAPTSTCKRLARGRDASPYDNARVGLLRREVELRHDPVEDH